MYKFSSNPLKVVGVEFTESKVFYSLENREGYKHLFVESDYVSPVEKQEA